MECGVWLFSDNQEASTKISCLVTSSALGIRCPYQDSHHTSTPPAFVLSKHDVGKVDRGCEVRGEQCNKELTSSVLPNGENRG